MIEKEVIVKNRAGIHTRPAATLVKSAGKYKCEFYIIKDDFQINGKSIIGVMSLAVEQGATLNLIFDGDDENEACEEIVNLFETGFNEL